jgi:hypothetical protein
MNWEMDKKKKLAEYLWTEINKAIIKSPEVQVSIKKLHELQLLDYVSEFNLVLEVDKLIEGILKQNLAQEGNNHEVKNVKDEILEATTNSVLKELQLESKQENNLEENGATNISSPLSNGPVQWVDGKALSENEIRFEEYFEQRFNEKHWMKKAKIRFDS